MDSVFCLKILTCLTRDFIFSEKQKKPRSKERKTSKRKSVIDSDDDDEVFGNSIKHKERDRKRKKQVSVRRVIRKPVFAVSDQVQLEPGCTATRCLEV